MISLPLGLFIIFILFYYIIVMIEAREYKTKKEFLINLIPFVGIIISVIKYYKNLK